MATLGGIVTAVLSEAELRGIDLSALMEESFTSRSHLSMVARHELKVRMIYREVYRPVRKPSVTVYPDGMLGAVDNVPQFTKKQIEIAEAVLQGRDK